MNTLTLADLQREAEEYGFCMMVNEGYLDIVKLGKFPSSYHALETVDHPRVLLDGWQWIRRTRLLDTREHLVRYARQIAIHTSNTELVNGLQSDQVLLAKRLQELRELREAVLHESWLHWLYKASDVLYYSACLDEQRPPVPFVAGSWYNAQRHITALDIKWEDAQAAALAKYRWRAEKPDNHNEAYELQLIEQSIETMYP